MSSDQFNPEAEFFALRTFRFDEQDYNHGDVFKPKNINARKLALLYDLRKIGYEWLLSGYTAKPKPAVKKKTPKKPKN